VTDRHPATVGHATSAPDACSILWQRDGTSAYGTAARAGFFVVIAQPGPWGRKAAEESHLPREVGIELDGRAAAAGGRFMLMRRPGPHVDRHGRHAVLVAHAGDAAADAWLLAGEVDGAEDLLSLDWAALAAGRIEAVAASLPGAQASPPVLLICTNGRRDVCCAVRGRPLAAAAADLDPERVWEVSHTGGHRFAPTGVLLPWGQALARLDVETAALALEASLTSEVPRALLGPTHDRGRSALPAELQAAESFVRHRVAETRLCCLTTEAVDAGNGTADGAADGGRDGSVSHARVRHDDGREWLVRITRRDTGQQRPESCGKAPVEVHEYEVTLAG
jgi:hypothetical protein